MLSLSLPFIRLILRLLTAALMASAAPAFLGRAGAQSQIMQQFDGIAQGGSGCPSAIPPDPSGAAGPSGLLQTVNRCMAYFPKRGGLASPLGGAPLWQVSLDTAATLPGLATTANSRGAFDPRVLYDWQSGRFFMLVLEVGPANGWFHIMVSRTDDPKGLPAPAGSATTRSFNPADWYIYRYENTLRDGPFSPAEPGGVDYPAIGADGVNFYATGNIFKLNRSYTNINGQRVFLDAPETGVWAFGKAALLAGPGSVGAMPAAPPPPAVNRTSSSDSWTKQPAMVLDPPPNNPDAWFVSMGSTADDLLWCDYFDELTTNFRHDEDETDINFRATPGPAPQPDFPPPGGWTTVPTGWPAGVPFPPPSLDTNGDRMMSAVRVNGRMWCVLTDKRLDDNRAVVRWFRLRPQPGSTVLEAEGILDAGGIKHNFQPAIGANPNGDLCIVWTTSSTSDLPGIYYATSRNGGPFEAPTEIITSAYALDSFDARRGYARWGDYASVTCDPVDHSFWVLHEYVGSSTPDGWATRWAQISPCPLPVITQQPYATTAQNSTPVHTTKQVCQGETVFLGITASGYSSLRWLRQGQPVAGGTSPVLTFNSVALADQASYSVELTNACGVKTWSQPVVLDVVVPPVAVMNRSELFVGRGLASYLEVIPDAALLAEMGPLTYTWNRSSPYTALGGKVQIFEYYLRTAEEAKAIEGVWSCQVSGPCGSITVTADVFSGPRITGQPFAPAGTLACGPPVDLTVGVRGTRRSAPATQRPDFGGFHGNNFPFYFQEEEFFYSYQWRHRGVPIVPDAHFQLLNGGATLRINHPDYADEGDYDCVVMDTGWGDVNPATTTRTWLTLQPTPPWLTVSATGPDPRDGHGIIYDTERKVTVLFGGHARGRDPRPGFPDYHGNYEADDTWTWDGTAWTEQNPAHRPPPLSGFGLAWDELRNRVVLFGGRRADASYSDETWEWDGTDWSRITTATVPAARDRSSMCYDTVRNETLLLGGEIVPAAGDYYAERKKLWAFNGTNWTLRDSGFVGDAFTVPSSGPGFAFDEHRGVAVLLQSLFQGKSLPEWNGTMWQPGIALPQQLDPGVNAGAWYDPFRRLVSLAGGSPSGASPHKAILHYTGSSVFSEIPAVVDDLTGSPLDVTQVRPSARHEVAYDRDRRVLVWFDSPEPYYSGPAFTREIHYSCRPQLAHLPASVTVQTGQTAELSAGAAGLRPLTWRWRKNGVVLNDGGNLFGTSTPHLKIQQASAADQAAYSVTVTNAYGTVTSATAALIVTGPPLAALTFPAGAAPVDTPSLRGSLSAISWNVATPGSGTLVISSGAISGLPPDAVLSWRHNGRPVPAGPGIAISSTGNSSTLTLTNPDYAQEGDWELHAETPGPPAAGRIIQWHRVRVPGDVAFTTVLEGGPERRSGHVMAYDTRRGVMVLFGGNAYGRLPGANSATSYSSDETWEYDGTGWVRRMPVVSPPPLEEAGMAYDARRGRMVLFGGRKYASSQAGSPFSYSAGTWEWDGLTWAPMTPAVSPPARTLPSMCYDTRRGEVLMMGGDYVGTSNDPYEIRHALWSWNGLNWTRRAAILPQRPGGNQVYGQNAFAFDEARGVAVLFGSLSGGNSDYDVFEWDGILWHAVSPQLPAAGESLLRNSSTGTAFYDPARRMIGITGAVAFNNEKSLRYWDGIRYFMDQSLLVDDLSGLTYQPYQAAPRVAWSCAFDRARRALVWFDGPNDNSSLLGRRFTREIHFTSMPKILRLPPIHHAEAGRSAVLRGIAAGKGPLRWQWSHGLVVDSGVVHAASTSILTRAPLVEADAGAWQLAVSNDQGTAHANTTLVLGAAGLSQQTAGAGLWLAWPAGGLETSPDLAAGSWSGVPGATSPQYVPLLEPRGFFRVVGP